MNIQSIIQKQINDFNGHHIDAFVAPYAAEAKSLDPYYEQPLIGKEAIRQDIIDFFQGFPDIKGNITGQILISGNTAAFELELTGTHKGNLPSPNGPIPPTNRNVRILMARFLEFTGDGKIKSDNRYYDTMSIMAQLGLMPENV
jgi:steroid delta-isomerase-like uncharacterized protein